VIRAELRTAGLLTYFTAGVKEVRAWTVRRGSTAPQAAGVIHTDFEHGFIRAEVISYEEFVRCRGEAGAKEAGKMRLEGKEYVAAKATSCTSDLTSDQRRLGAPGGAVTGIASIRARTSSTSRFQVRQQRAQCCRDVLVF